MTFSGGEPFLQAEALSEVACLVRTVGKSVAIFTGYEWDELQESEDPSHCALLAQTDSLIAGPYCREVPSSHPILGSGNQRLVHLTDRYRDEDFLAGSPSNQGRRTEIRVTPDGTLSVTGIPNPSLRRGLASRNPST